MPDPCLECKLKNLDKTRGLCGMCEPRKDYERSEECVLDAANTEEVGLKEEIMAEKKTCIVKDCEKPVYVKGLCDACYARARKMKARGEVFDPAVPAPAPGSGRHESTRTCDEDGCDEKHLSKGKCSSHYYEKILKPIRERGRANNKAKPATAAVIEGPILDKSEENALLLPNLPKPPESIVETYKTQLLVWQLRLDDLASKASEIAVDKSNTEQRIGLLEALIRLS